jgi:hypothetical protein
LAKRPLGDANLAGPTRKPETAGPRTPKAVVLNQATRVRQFDFGIGFVSLPERLQERILSIVVKEESDLRRDLIADIK